MNMNIGDVVVLKSGGPKMTITKTYQDELGGNMIAECMWFNVSNTASFTAASTATFPTNALQLQH